LLEHALDAARAAMAPDDELIVVDSASRSDGTAKVGAEAGAYVVRCDRPGAARARNAGWRAASAPIVAFTDDDCRPQPGWLDAVASAFADDSVGVIVGRVLPDRESHAIAVSVNTDTERRRFDRPIDPMGVGQSANMACRREALDDVGGFDEALGPGARFPNGEDYDLLWRVLAAGWSGLYEPDAVVTHVQWRTRREGLKAYYLYGIGDGAFAAKVGHRDRVAGREMLVDRLWRRGIAQAFRNLRGGYELGFAADALKAAGVAVGAARCWRVPIDEVGHLLG